MNATTEPKPRKRNRTGERLRARGFDLTTYDRESGYYRVRCSECQALVIQWHGHARDRLPELTMNTPASGTVAQVAIQCIHPETRKQGCWLFVGDSHRIPGTAVSPFFNDLVELFKWAPENGWTPKGYDYIKQ